MRKTKSPILEAVHETVVGLHMVGVMDRVTMRKFDQMCLPKTSAAIDGDRPIHFGCT